MKRPAMIYIKMSEVNPPPAARASQRGSLDLLFILNLSITFTTCQSGFLQVTLSLSRSLDAAVDICSPSCSIAEDIHSLPIFKGKVLTSRIWAMTWARDILLFVMTKSSLFICLPGLEYQGQVRGWYDI